MRVKELMTSDVRTCRPESNLAEAGREMWDGDCGALPIVNDEGRVTGMITDRDICIALATKGRPADRVAVRDVVHNHAYTCLPEDDATTALHTMQAHQVRRLPVVDADGHIRGILSLNDVVTHAGSAPPSEVMSTLAGICAHRGTIATAGAG